MKKPSAVNSKPTVNPASRFTSKPFPEQKQAWPALQREMRPVPDCGEESYRGSGKLTGRKALVTGGDSGIGRAAVIAFLREGADGAINYFPTEEPDAQDLAELARKDGTKLVLLPGDITDQDFCKELVTHASSELGGLDILVNNAAYQQSKTSIDEITHEQIRVNAVAPGPVWPPLQVAGDQLPGKLGEFGQDTPLGRAGQPAELGPIYVALASNDLSFNHGSVFGANGGTGIV